MGGRGRIKAAKMEGVLDSTYRHPSAFAAQKQKPAIKNLWR